MSIKPQIWLNRGFIKLIYTPHVEDESDLCKKICVPKFYSQSPQLLRRAAKSQTSQGPSTGPILTRCVGSDSLLNLSELQHPHPSKKESLSYDVMTKGEWSTKLLTQSRKLK